jgi:hypothetical protein
MKNFITRTAAIAVLASGAILAQGPLNHGRGSGPGDQGNNANANPPDVATVVAREVSFLTSLLTLTAAQQTQATTIFTTALNSINTQQTTITTARTALATAVKANDNTAISTQSTAIGNAEGQIVALQARADAAFYALLAADQKTKLLAADDDFGSELGFGGLHLPGGGH